MSKAGKLTFGAVVFAVCTAVGFVNDCLSLKDRFAAGESELMPVPIVRPGPDDDRFHTSPNPPDVIPDIPPDPPATKDPNDFDRRQRPKATPPTQRHQVVPTGTVHVLFRCSSGPNTRVLSDPTSKSTQVDGVNVGETVELLGREAVDADYNANWRWHQVKTKRGVIGWLHQNSLEGFHASSPPCRNR